MAKQTNYHIYIEWLILAMCFVAMMKYANYDGILDKLKPESTQEKILMSIGMFIMAHFVLAIHELGHLITGILQGFRFELFVVGLLGIKREDNRVKVYLNKNLGYYGGVAASAPVIESAENPKIFARVLLAGPIVSILFAIICYLIAITILKPFGIIFYTGALVSIGIFIATTVPSTTGMFFTDRKRYQRLVTPGKEQDIELAMINIMAKYSRDNSYAKVEQSEIQTIMSDDSESMQYFGLYNMICWQIEHQKQIDDGTLAMYESLSKKMSKGVVKMFNKEIENYKNRFLKNANN